MSPFPPLPLPSPLRAMPLNVLSPLSGRSTSPLNPAAITLLAWCPAASGKNYPAAYALRLTPKLPAKREPPCGLSRAALPALVTLSTLIFECPPAILWSFIVSNSFIKYKPALLMPDLLRLVSYRLILIIGNNNHIASNIAHQFSR